MLSNKDINFNDETQVLIINGEKHPIGEAIKHTLKYIDPATIDAAELARGGVVARTSSFFSIKNGRVGLGLCIDTGESNNYLIALLYRKSSNEKVKFVEIAKNGLYISETNDQGTAAITGNTGTRVAYTIVFY